MKILVYSDVHGNLPAFEKMLKAEGPCEAYISLGDLVNYGPWSNECVDLAVSLPNSVLLMGNHEEAFINGYYPGGNRLVQKFFDAAFIGFNKTGLINAFLSSFMLNNFQCIHTIQNKYVYPDTDVILDGDYLIGHSHHQFCYQNNGFVLFNAGSVGQNRQFINTASYLLYDTETGKVEMKRTNFDIQVVINEMVLRNYPKDCIDYYKNKPTC